MYQQLIDQAVAHYRTLLESQIKRAENMNSAADEKKKEKTVIGLVGGDGIGPIITCQAQRALEALLKDEIAQGKIELKTIEGLTIEKLNSIYQSIIRRQENKIDPIRSKFGKIEKEEVSLSDKMLEMKEYAATHRKFSFRQLLTAQDSRIQVIVTFLSILELMKMGHIQVEQDHLFDDIQVQVVTDPETWKNLTEFADE